MRNILVVISIFALMECAPIDQEIEIEKQNLIRFPDDPKPFNNAQSDTQRILEEIEKINIKLGYKKFRSPSNQYSFSKPLFSSYGIGLVGGGKLEPSIRSFKTYSSPNSKVKMQKDNYYRIPLQLLRMSKNKYIESTNASVIRAKGYQIVGNFNISNKLLRSIRTSNNTNNNNVKVFLIPFSKIKELKMVDTTTPNTKNTSVNNWQVIKVKKHNDIKSKPVERTMPISYNQISRPSTINDSKPLIHYNNIPKPINQNKPAVILQSIKSSINSLINKPTLKPIKQNILANKPKNSTNVPEYSDEYYNDSEEKTFLPTIKKQTLKEQNETLKDGGIIIQRLKVRKGGIAIAGPGGIATAGSGGTAIVGPGGLALTHPKSLTIAGPGAKILAYPTDTDLKDILLSDNENLLNNGKIVATGPAIYYNTGS